MELTKFNSCGFGFNTLGEKERNFVLKDSADASKILASFVCGVLEVFHNSVYIESEFPEMNESDANNVLKTQYLQAKANVVITDMKENGVFNYLCVECGYIDAKLTLENFFDCYGDLIVETI